MNKILIFIVTLTCCIMQNKDADHQKMKPVHFQLLAMAVFSIFYIQTSDPIGSPDLAVLCLAPLQ